MLLIFFQLIVIVIIIILPYPHLSEWFSSSIVKLFCFDFNMQLFKRREILKDLLKLLCLFEYFDFWFENLKSFLISIKQASLRSISIKQDNFRSILVLLFQSLNIKKLNLGVLFWPTWYKQNQKLDEQIQEGQI